MKNGIVHYRNINSFTFVVKLNDETFSVFESPHIDAFKPGDIISGHLDQCGIYELLNTRTQKYTFVLIQNVGLNEHMAIDRANVI